jgi:elongation factor G
LKIYKTEDIRNIVLIGHGGSGKTSLTSALTFSTGGQTRLGKVDDGTALTDFDDEELERKISLQTATVHAERDQKKVNLIDTPGYAAFIADAKVATAAADCGLLVIEGVSGVQLISEKTFGYCTASELPLIFVINKLDRENASFERSLESIQTRFGRTAVPVQLPIGSEHDFSGVVDLLVMKAFTTAQDESFKTTVSEIPEELQEAASEARAALIEMVAETDDALMEQFFEAGDLSADQLLGGLHKAILARSIFPVCCSAATTMIGASRLLDLLIELAPAPHERGDAIGIDPGNNEEVSRPVDSAQPVSLQVFKTLADPFAGKLSMFRVRSGTLKADSHVININRDEQVERLGAVSLMNGKQMDPIAELRAGDIGVIAKLKVTLTGDTLTDAHQKIQYPVVTFAKAAISYAIEPKSKGDEEKISTALNRLMEEDPVLRCHRDPQTGELLVSGTGQSHVEVVLSKMKRKFGVEALLHPPKVPYFETIKKSVQNVEGKHKKQSGGRGQFGVCVINLEPLPRGSGFEFVDKIFGGSIPQNYRPAVEKGVIETAQRGWLAGSQVIDFRVTLTDGKYHNVDSSEMAFKIAGSMAFKTAMSKASPTILEPVMVVEITAPEDCMGDIMGDLSSRRGKPQGMEAMGALQVIKAMVPMSEMLEYSSTLKSLTSDRASYSMEFDHYQEAPAHIREQIIAKAAKEKEETAG